MRATSARPAGADNFLKLRRSLDEHLELGWLTRDAFFLFVWLCLKAEPRTGTLRTRWTVLAEQTTLTVNYVGKLCGRLKKKGYIDYATHRGQRGKLVTLAIDKFPLPDGSYTALGASARRTPSHLPADLPTDLSADLPAHLPAELPAELEAQTSSKSSTSLGGRSRSRSRKRSRSSLRVRSADAVTHPTTDSSDFEGRLDRAEALAAAPRALRETVELYWLKTGCDGLTPEDLSALRALDQAHTPAVIQKAITESVDRFTRRGDDPRAVTFQYVWDSLRRFTTRKAPAATAIPQRPVYPPGLTRLS